MTPSARVHVRGSGTVGAPFPARDLSFYENGDTVDAFPNLQLLRGISEGRMIREKIEKREPLRLENEDFVNAVLEQRTALVTREDSLKALRTASALVQAGQEHSVVNIAV